MKKPSYMNEDIKKLYSNELKNVLNTMSTVLINDNPTVNITIEYFLLAVLETRDSKAYKTLDKCFNTLTLETIHSAFYEIIHSRSLTAIKPKREIIWDKELMQMFLNANIEREKLNELQITSEHVFLAILNNENKVKEALKNSGLTYSIFFNRVIEELKEREDNEFIDELFDLSKPANNMVNHISNNIPSKTKKNKTNIIHTYCIDLNKIADEGKIDSLIGRTNEVNQIIKILGRRKKNNAVLVGEGGTGKTSIVTGLAKMIQEGNVPTSLMKKRIVSLDMTAMIAGTKYRGEFEERMKGLLDELKDNKNYILFIDDIHSVLSDKGKIGDIDISAMIGNALSNGEMQVIGATSFTDYRHTFDKSTSLARRFQKIIINPTTINETIVIMENIKDYYEKFHNVQYSDEAIKACVELANKYISERHLPDSAIDIMDEVGASMSISINEPDEIRELRMSLISIRKDKQDAVLHDDIERQERCDINENKIKIKINEKDREYKSSLQKNPIVIDVNKIYDIVSEKTGIPITKLNSDEKKKLASIDNILKNSIIGQDDAIEKVCRVIKRSRVGLSNQGKTMGNLFFLGGSGVGKSLLAKTLAKEIFGDEKYLVRFDMSEYADKTSINKLIGSNPGYVGYDSGGQLTEKIKNKKHCVLLLDEIEKADPEVYNIFLQVFDEGHLTDNTGQQIDFKNVIVILTSNVGVREANERGGGIGFSINVNDNRRQILQKELKKKFPPEFINRLDDIVYFNTLTDDNYKEIIKLQLKYLAKKVENIGYTITFNDEIIDILFNLVSSEREYGARPILRIIQDEIENKITDLILENNYTEHNFIVKPNENNTNFIVI